KRLLMGIASRRRASTLALAISCGLVTGGCGDAQSNSGQATVFEGNGLVSMTGMTGVGLQTELEVPALFTVGNRPIRLTNVTIDNPPLVMTVLGAHAFDFGFGGPVDWVGPLPSDEDNTPHPVSAEVVSHQGSNWNVMVFFVFHKPGKFTIGRFRVDYQIDGHAGWQYVYVHTTYFVYIAAGYDYLMNCKCSHAPPASDGGGPPPP
ncbi:MAG TPA: hypothetical protein VGS21_10885, partial [Acidimicrobiales bacterium]|nr:hypothetical protein [Acidimicrobiales bacterium]